MNRLRSSNWLLIGLAAGMILLALAGVALLAVSSRWRSNRLRAKVGLTLADLEFEAVAQLAVLTLAGEVDERIISRRT